ncbi:MAG: hypothetical protein HN389_06240 [Clostridia bacterium]|nr:hypothetical protein [Clostridia bacterium]
MKAHLKVKRILATIIVLIILAALPTLAFAADINVAADTTSVQVGDNVTVTVTVQADHIAVADGVFTYDPSLLSYISSTGGASDGYINLVSLQEGGSSSLTTVIKFAAIGDGEAIIDVSIENTLSYDGESLGSAQAGVSITVASSGDSSETDGDTSAVLDLSQTGILAQNVLGTDAQMYIWPSLRNLSLPSGFTDRQVTYNDEYVGGAAIPDIEDILLLYLSETAGENAGYYIYDQINDVFFPYLTVTSISAKFTLLWPNESIEVPEGFEQTTLTIGERQMPAWTYPGPSESVYLVYVRSASGEVGFYLYNTEDRSLQRYDANAQQSPEPAATPQPSPTAAPTATPAPTQVADKQTDTAVKIEPAILIVVLAACALFAVAAIVFALLYLRSSSRQKKERKKSIHIKKADL